MVEKSQDRVSHVYGTVMETKLFRIYNAIIVRIMGMEPIDVRQTSACGVGRQSLVTSGQDVLVEIKVKIALSRRKQKLENQSAITVQK